ncbi:MAG: hypothetical protein IJ094_07835 [Bacilli bacterium]|nr:hypothetical protein [Bacilli bacterium]
MKKEFKKDTLNNSKNQKIINQLKMYSEDLNRYTFDAVANDYQAEHLERITNTIRYLKSCVYSLRECILKEPYRNKDNVDIEYLKMLDEYSDNLSEFSMYINCSLNSTIEEIKTAVDGFINLYIAFFEEFHKYDSLHDNKAKLSDFRYVDDYKVEKDKCISKIKKYNEKYNY